MNLATLVASQNKSQYHLQQLETGILKPSIFLGIDPSSTLMLRSSGLKVQHAQVVFVTSWMAEVFGVSKD